jgi:hypothetical protein
MDKTNKYREGEKERRGRKRVGERERNKATGMNRKGDIAS